MNKEIVNKSFRGILFILCLLMPISGNANHQELIAWKKLHQKGSLHYCHWVDLPQQPLQILLEIDNETVLELNNLITQYWMDFPQPSMQILLEIDNKASLEPDDLITQYHAINKNTDDLLQKRFIALEKITELFVILLDRSHDEELKCKINDLKNLAIGKKNYLSHLLELKSQDLNKLHEEIKNSSLILNEYEPVFIADDARYDFSKGEYWGEYQFEALDPCHRELTDYILKWRQQTGNKDYFSPDFFLWLETKYVSSATRVSMLLTNEEIEKFQVTIKDGILYDVSSSFANFSDPHVEYMFVVDHQGRLLITASDKFIHHTSISQWRPVIGCGAIKVKEGKIQEISFESGHYLPSTAAAVQTFVYFKNLGVELDKQMVVTYFTPKGKQKLPLNDFLKYYDKDMLFWGKIKH